MGLFDSFKGAHASDHDENLDVRAAQVPVGTARHVDRDAPPERMEDATLVTGGKHKA
jgi:hypothetical protein